MDLLLLVDRTVAQADIGDIVDVAVLHPGGMRPADDVDVVFQRHLGQRLADLGRVPAQRLDRFLRAQFLFREGEQRQGEQLGKEDEVGFVIGGDVDEIFDAAHELVVILYRAGLQLAGRDAHLLDAAGQAELGRLVAVDEGILPDHANRVGLRLLVLWQVVLHHAVGLEPVGHLEAQDRIVELGLDHLLKIILRPLDAAPEAAEIGHPPREHDAGQF